jgi:hypothetical protein
LFFSAFYQTAFSQTDSTAYQKFYSSFLKLFKEISVPPLKNYYNALEQTASFTFTPLDPLFVDALSEISGSSNNSEAAAVDSLFFKVFGQLRKQDLWISATAIYNTKKELFELYNGRLCPCISSKITEPDITEKLLKVVINCNNDLAKDSSFINSLKRGANYAVNDFYRLQQYFSMYLYSACEILNYKMNEVIKNSSALSSYYAGIGYLKRKAGEDAIRYFTNNQWDSLAIIFPGYKKYIPEFKKIVVKLKKATGKPRTHFDGEIQTKIPQIVLTYIKGDQSELLGEVIMATSANTINAKIVSVKYNAISNKNRNDEEIIMQAPSGKIQ